jgi:acetate kinase
MGQGRRCRHRLRTAGLPELDEAANRDNRERISAPNSRVGAYVIKTDENLMIARHARALVGS